MRRPISGSSANAVSTRPNVSWVDTALLMSTRVLEWDVDERSRLDCLVVQLAADPGTGSARRTLRQETFPFVLRSSVRDDLAERGDLLSVSIAAWFKGSPAIGNPQPLIV